MIATTYQHTSIKYTSVDDLDSNTNTEHWIFRCYNFFVYIYRVQIGAVGALVGLKYPGL